MIAMGASFNLVFTCSCSCSCNGLSAFYSAGTLPSGGYLSVRAKEGVDRW